jgi:hypothetical protein
VTIGEIRRSVETKQSDEVLGTWDGGTVAMERERRVRAAATGDFSAERPKLQHVVCSPRQASL